MIIANNKKMNTEIKVFNKPKLVYIPLISGNDTNITVLVNKGEYVYKGSIIGKRKGDFRIPIHSSVSGIVVDFEEKACLNGTLVKCVVIENDFKEKILPREEVKTKYTKEEFIECLKENGRLCIITFHSLEDRAVKNAYIEAQGHCTCPKELPYCVCNYKSYGKIINKKPIEATEQEKEENSRSKSAKLRIFERKI